MGLQELPGATTRRAAAPEGRARRATAVAGSSGALGGSIGDAGRAAALWLVGLVLVLPFEPRHPTLPVLGVQMTLLEVVAGCAVVALIWLSRNRLGALVRRPPLPLFLLAAYAAAHAASAAVAEDHRDLALKFALRMATMAAFALAVAAAPSRARHAGLVAVAAAAVVVSLLAVLEGAGVRSLDAVLNHFREMPFNVAGSRRASAGSEYPNLAAAFLMYGLLTGVGLAACCGRSWRWVLPGSALLSCGLLCTYSRGALVATVLALLVVAGTLLVRDRPRAQAPLAALVVLLAVAAAFLSAGEISRLRLETEGIGSWYGAAYAPEEDSLALRPGETHETAVSVTNTGLKAWNIREAFHLSHHWYDEERRFLGDGGRTALPRDLASGESVSLRAEVRAPAGEGRYLLVWDMVHEHTTWFSGQGVRPAVVGLTVSRSAAAMPAAPAAADLATSLAWRPGRRELWPLALGMWRDHPWLGVGPDNFRWLHGPRAGHPAWDARIFANNTLLEAAATTGLAGLVALAGTLIAAGARAWRGFRAAAPGSNGQAVALALMALVAGIAAHGAVDYVLAFTGHYLLFGFVVGAVSGIEA